MKIRKRLRRKNENSILFGKYFWIITCTIVTVILFDILFDISDLGLYSDALLEIVFIAIILHIYMFIFGAISIKSITRFLKRFNLRRFFD